MTKSLTDTDPTLSELSTVLDEKTNIKDPKPFDIDEEITPPIHYEREQFKKMAMNVLNFLKGLGRQHLLIIGPRGSGKTGIVKYLLTQLNTLEPDKFITKYINCKGQETTYMVLKELYHLHKKTPRMEALETFEKDVVSRGAVKTILVLDEVDLLKDDDLFYHVSRDPKYKNVLLILITKTIRFYRDLSADVKSSLSTTEHYFDQYNGPQIQQILLKRAQAGLLSYDEGVITKIAQNAANHVSGDVRVAIKVCLGWFNNKDYVRFDPAKGGELEKEIRKLVQNEYVVMKERTIRALPEIKLCILKTLTEQPIGSRALEQFNHTYPDKKMSRPHFLSLADELTYSELLTKRKERMNKANVYVYRELIGEGNKALVDRLLSDPSIGQIL